MDRKERWQVSRLHAQTAAGRFTEEDVFALLMLLREYSPKGSSVRECADFIAHREKDRGLVFEYLERTKLLFENLGKANATIEIKPVFSCVDLENCLAMCLASFGLAALDAHQVNNVLVCMISLLQDVQLVRRDGSPIGVLEVGVTSAEVMLLGKVRIDSRGVEIAFPVLVAKNDFMELPESTVPFIFNGVSSARCQDGRMSLVQATGG